MNIKTTIVCLGIAGLLANQGVEGAAIEYFFGINFENPAELQRVKTGEINLGLDYLHPKLKFKGSTTLGSGTAKSSTTIYMPSCEIAYRLRERIVVALSYTNPYLATINWGKNSILRETSTKTFVYETKVGPRFSCQCTDNLALGFGLDCNFGWVGDQLNFVVPGFGNLKNKFHYLWLGINVGLFYRFFCKNFISACFYSGENAVAHGHSTTQNGLSNDHFSINPPNPWFVYVNWIRNFNDHFAGFFKVLYSGFSISKELDLNNTAVGDFIFPTHWKNTWTFDLGGKYLINENWELTGLIEYNTNFARRKFNSVAYPGAPTGVVEIGLSRKFCENFRLYLNYGYSAFIPKAKIDEVATGDRGKVSLSGQYVGARIVISW